MATRRRTSNDVSADLEERVVDAVIALAEEVGGSGADVAVPPDAARLGGRQERKTGPDAKFSAEASGGRGRADDPSVRPAATHGCDRLKGCVNARAGIIVAWLPINAS